MVKSIKKTGFSLAEVLVSMLVLSVFFVATSKVITTKPKKEIQHYRHGYFECYSDGGQLYQKREDSGVTPKEPEKVNSCLFSPPKDIAALYINVMHMGYGPDDEGNEDVYTRRYYFYSEPIVDTDITMRSEDLSSFESNFDETSKGININVDSNNEYTFRNYLQSGYPTSSILKKLQDERSYSGPAVFLSW